MALVVILWAAYFALVYCTVTHKIGWSSFTEAAAVLAVAFFALVFWSVRYVTGQAKKQGMTNAAARTRRPAPAQPADVSPAVSSAADSGMITFRVAGTTFNNDDGTSRQEILRHLKFGDPPWADDPDDLEAEIEETTFRGEQAFIVLVNGYQVGFVPKVSIRKVADALDHVATCQVTGIRIAGGGTDRDGRPVSWGCEITLEY